MFVSLTALSDTLNVPAKPHVLLSNRDVYNILKLLVRYIKRRLRFIPKLS